MTYRVEPITSAAEALYPALAQLPGDPLYGCNPAMPPIPSRNQWIWYVREREVLGAWDGDELRGVLIYAGGDVDWLIAWAGDWLGVAAALLDGTGQAMSGDMENARLRAQFAEHPRGSVEGKRLRWQP